jgi:YHS domain-containing protein
MFSPIRTLFIAAFGLALLAASASNTHAGTKDAINKTADGLAIKGHDAVAYFTEGKAVKGSENFDYKYKDATYRFASAENRDMFKKNPEKYAPQFGGYCAWGLSIGKLFDVEPTLWRIVDGKLYLQFNADVDAAWARDVKGFIARGNANWPTVLDKN